MKKERKVLKKLNEQEQQATKDLKAYLAKQNYQYYLAYETGSQLTHLAGPKSDVDFYVFYVPDKWELLTQNIECDNFVQLPTCEIKLIAMPQMIRLLLQGDPNVVELFFQEPLLISDDNNEINNKLAELANLLYENRELLPYLSGTRYIKTCIYMMKKNVRKLRPNKRYIGNGSFGKTLFEYVKEYNYAEAFLQNAASNGNTKFEDSVFPSEKMLNTYKNYKKVNKFNKKMRSAAFKKYDYHAINRWQRDLKRQHKFNNTNSKQAKQLLHQIVIDTPVYY